MTKKYTTRGFVPATVKVLTATTLTLAVAACRPGEEPGSHVAGWALIDASQRHPIVVSQQPARMSVAIARGSHGLSPHQRSHVIDFLNKYRGSDTGNSKLVVSVPNGAPNEVAALHAVADLRDILRDYGLDDSRVAVEPYHSEGDHQPPIRIAYSRFIAEGPACGNWWANTADDPRNLPYPNLGCATQRNFAAHVANPADLLGPRTQTQGSAERRDTVWQKYVKGESTVSKKDGDERVQVKGN